MVLQYVKDTLKIYLEEQTQEAYREFWDAAYAFLSDYCTSPDEIEKFLDNDMYPELDENMDFDLTIETIQAFAESFV